MPSTKDRQALCKKCKKGIATKSSRASKRLRSSKSTRSRKSVKPSKSNKKAENEKKRQVLRNWITRKRREFNNEDSSSQTTSKIPKRAILFCVMTDTVKEKSALCAIIATKRKRTKKNNKPIQIIAELRMSTKFHFKRVFEIVEKMCREQGIDDIDDHSYLLEVKSVNAFEGNSFSLAAGIALYAVCSGTTVKNETIVIGKLDKTGNIEWDEYAEEEVKHAIKHNFQQVLMPFTNLPHVSEEHKQAIDCNGIRTFKDALELMVVHPSSMQRHNAGADDVSTNDYDTFVEKSVKHTKSPESIESGSITDQNITDTDEVKDLGNYVFFIFMMFGFGALLPWNMFLNISFDYYTMFKLRSADGNATWYSSNFQNSMTISAQIPSLVFSVINIFIAVKGDLTRGMKICLIVVQLMVIVTVVFIYIDTSTWIATFSMLTLGTIVVLNAANGLFQNSMFGLASPFPFKYTNAVIIGQNFCGTAVTVLSMLTKAASDDVQMRASLFFGLSSVAVVVCFILLNFLKRLAFYKKFGILRTSSQSDEEGISSWESVKLAFEKSKMQFANIFVLFFVTLALFPNVCMYVKDAKKGELHSFVVPEKYFMDVVTFLNFNLFAFLGSLMANWIRFPGPNTVWICVAARFWFMFYFPAANYHPMDFPRAYPVLFESTWLFAFNICIFALTSGYLSSLIMMYAPRSHEDPKIQRMAGMIASFFLIFGIVAGLVFSWQIRLFMTGYA
ncbi:Equilibrative Nucleoside Transporter [Caenorhabditis elegans]|uniref:Equilibrative Nucleoside Transporter n=1 Tax=Caenorhabditis elegans TaxID=6239 RepID=Q21145_CAEEL|nr:Equilibrative Nucleoside Transporter [Caenorhabditis elegans]CAB01223.2 Equilibrative Nucleoside Transporter [Caenorhabditis elegans]|eukprot:NP_506521.2 Equilibrative Nucleoside Transporter [Caenorhabditis elegans]